MLPTLIFSVILVGTSTLGIHTSVIFNLVLLPSFLRITVYSSIF